MMTAWWYLRGLNNRADLTRSTLGLGGDSITIVKTNNLNNFVLIQGRRDIEGESNGVKNMFSLGISLLRDAPSNKYDPVYG